MQEYIECKKSNGEYEAVDRVTYVKERIAPKLETMLVASKDRKKNVSYNKKVYDILMRVFLEGKRMSTNEALDITIDKFKAIEIDFLDIMEFIGEYVDFVPNKSLFAAFAGITNAMYDALLKSPNEEVANEMQSFDEYLVNEQTTGAQDNLVSANMTKFALQAKGYGHGVTTATNIQQSLEVINNLLAPAEAMKSLNSIYEKNHLKPPAPKQDKK